MIDWKDGYRELSRDRACWGGFIWEGIQGEKKVHRTGIVNIQT